MAHILLIDDDPVVLESVQFMLESGDHTVEKATDGNEGIQRLADGKFDLIITDVVMPEKDGIGVLLEARQMNEATKILVMSGGGRISSTDYLETAEALGADAILPKPFSTVDLLSKVDTVIAGNA